MRGTAFALVVALFAASSTAERLPTLSLSTDKLTYNVGETITVTVFGDDGDPGYPSYGIYGRLDYNGALVDNGTRSQLRLVGARGDWILYSNGFLGAADTNAPGPGSFSESFNQVPPPPAGDADTALNLPDTLSTVTLIAASVGIVDLSWHTGDDFRLMFFGASAPGTSFTIVPEPTTAMLIGMGLCAMALRSHMRRERLVP